MAKKAKLGASRKARPFGVLGDRTGPYGWFDSALQKSMPAKPSKLSYDAVKKKDSLANLIDLPQPFVDGLIANIAGKSKVFSKYLIEEIASSKLAYDGASEFALATLKHGLKTDGAIAADFDYVFEWLLLQASCLKFIRSLKITKREKRLLSRLWAEMLTEKALTVMAPTIRMGSARTLDRSNLYASVTDPDSSKPIPKQRTDKNLGLVSTRTKKAKS